MDNFYNIRKMRMNNPLYLKSLKSQSREFLIESFKLEYAYNFDWLGTPIIQYPEDIVRIQELIWRLDPDCIIETGIARGGSLMLSASLMALLDLRNKKLNRKSVERKVIGVDIDIRDDNRSKIENHFLSDYIDMIEGSSIDINIFNKVKAKCSSMKNILVFLDSNHTHNHVLEELNLYSTFVKKGSYIVVFDTVAEIIGVNVLDNRPWGLGNNPMTAMDEFLNSNPNFEVDKTIDNLSTISCNQRGFLKRIS